MFFLIVAENFVQKLLRRFEDVEVYVGLEGSTKTSTSFYCPTLYIGYVGCYCRRRLPASVVLSPASLFHVIELGPFRPFGNAMIPASPPTTPHDPVPVPRWDRDSVFTRHNCTGRYCWERELAMEILSVCPSRLGTDSRPGEIETPGLHHMIA